MDDVSKKYKQELQWLKQHSTKKNTSRRKVKTVTGKQIDISTRMEHSTLWSEDLKESRDSVARGV